MMNTIPHNLIIQSSGHAPSNCENQFPIKGLFQKLEHLSSFRSVGKVRDSCCPIKMNPLSLARFDFVGDCNGSFGMPWTCGVIIFMDRHSSIWLVSSHMPKNGGANGALCPFFLPNHSDETIFVVLMRAAKHEYIIIILLSILLLNILDDILLQTDHTLLFLHLTLPKGELNRRKVRDLKNIMILLLLKLIFFVHERDDELDDLKEGIILFDGVFVIEGDFLFGGAGLLDEELCSLFGFH